MASMLQPTESISARHRAIRSPIGSWRFCARVSRATIPFARHDV